MRIWDKKTLPGTCYYTNITRNNLVPRWPGGVRVLSYKEANGDMPLDGVEFSRQLDWLSCMESHFQ